MQDPLKGAATNRRQFLSLAGLGALSVAGGGLLAGCSDKPATGPGTTSQSDLSKILPKYIPNTAVKPDVPGVIGANGAVSDAVFLAYPSNPVKTVSAIPGKGGSYTTMTPLWGSIPPSEGNSYYDAVNKALGVTLKMQPSDGNNYGNALPALFAADKLPDWIQIPSWNTATLNFGQAVSKFADLTPYLAGDKIKDYPNLANIPSGAWQSGVWNGKLYGLPVYPGGGGIVGTYFYRRDIFEKLNINADSIKTPDDLAALGAQLTSASAGQWAFDDLFGDDASYVAQLFHFPLNWGIDSGGKLFHKYETQEIIEALNWFSKIVKAGHVHPDAIAGNNQSSKQRFWSGKVCVNADGTGAWNGEDAKSGTAANPNYRRSAFKLMSSKGTPTFEVTPGARMFGYLNGKLKEDQIKELLSVANYIAAPYGSAEWLTVNYGAEGDTYTMTNSNPTLTEKGAKLTATSFQFLVTPPTPTTVSHGFTDVAKDYGAWQADLVKYAVKPAFYAMNVTEPSQYSSIGKAVTDMIQDVKFGRKSIADYQEAVKTWKAQGGDALKAFYEDIRSKYGTGQ
ncbi:MAG: sugar ABC transporter substrate-binding protein [Hamadaea sp.]|nr:sugar ABC transporter substrate-binding protein [Hamadaea sp.]